MTSSTTTTASARIRRSDALPGRVYAPSARPYRGLETLEYPFHDHSHIVTRCGRICLDNRKINLSTVFAGQNVGVKQVADQIWLVSFMHYDLGFFDNECCGWRPPRTLRRKSVTHTSGINRYLCDRNGPLGSGGRGRNRTIDTRIFSRS